MKYQKVKRISVLGNSFMYHSCDESNREMSWKGFILVHAKIIVVYVAFFSFTVICIVKWLNLSVWVAIILHVNKHELLEELLKKLFITVLDLLLHVSILGCYLESSLMQTFKNKIKYFALILKCSN